MRRPLYSARRNSVSSPKRFSKGRMGDWVEGYGGRLFLVLDSGLLFGLFCGSLLESLLGLLLVFVLGAAPWVVPWTCSLGSPCVVSWLRSSGRFCFVRRVAVWVGLSLRPGLSLSFAFGLLLGLVWDPLLPAPATTTQQLPARLHWVLGRNATAGPWSPLGVSRVEGNGGRLFLHPSSLPPTSPPPLPRRRVQCSATLPPSPPPPHSPPPKASAMLCHPFIPPLPHGCFP